MIVFAYYYYDLAYTAIRLCYHWYASSTAKRNYHISIIRHSYQRYPAVVVEY